ncbi:winged helix-turn-helix domain-containing protein [Streptomyces sp. NPDC005438]|uniref:ArsR/SmtB family transcription factor n=1 Tax=Streptomyces sp. NPDC005438 TaxID=3156880 RepID=UPI0033B7066E
MNADQPPDGDQLLRVLSALDNPHRLRIIAALGAGRNYVSQLAREIGIGRPLLHMHLQRLEAAGLVVGSLELSEGGKARKYFEVAPFRLELSPELIARAVRTLQGGGAGPGPDTDREPAEADGAPEPPRAEADAPTEERHEKHAEHERHAEHAEHAEHEKEEAQ